MKILDQIKLNVLAKTEFNHTMKNTKLSYDYSSGILSHYNKVLLSFDKNTFEPIDINMPTSISSLRRINVVLGLTNKVLTRNGDSTFSLYEKGRLLIYTHQDNITVFSTEQDKKNNFCKNYVREYISGELLL